MNRMNHDIVDMFNKAFNTNLRLNRGGMFADDSEYCCISLGDHEYEIFLRAGESTSITFNLEYIKDETVEALRLRLILSYTESVSRRLVSLKKKMKHLQDHYDLILTKARTHNVKNHDENN